MLKKTIVLMVVALAVAGCGGSPEVKKEPEKKPVLSKSDELRRKAKFTEAASLVGYDGKAINKNLNKIIDESENANKQLKELNDLR